MTENKLEMPEVFLYGKKRDKHKQSHFKIHVGRNYVLIDSAYANYLSRSDSNANQRIDFISEEAKELNWLSETKRVIMETLTKIIQADSATCSLTDSFGRTAKIRFYEGKKDLAAGSLWEHIGTWFYIRKAGNCIYIRDAYLHGSIPKMIDPRFELKVELDDPDADWVAKAKEIIADIIFTDLDREVIVGDKTARVSITTEADEVEPEFTFPDLKEFQHHMLMDFNQLMLTQSKEEAREINKRMWKRIGELGDISDCIREQKKAIQERKEDRMDLIQLLDEIVINNEAPSWHQLYCLRNRAESLFKTKKKELEGQEQLENCEY